MKIVAIIPARYASTRFPAKMLAKINGKSLIQRTYESAKSSKSLNSLLIATDHKEIFDHAKSFGANVVMTSPDCPTGSDRLMEALTKYPEQTHGDIIVNIQGDQPCIMPDTIEAILTPLKIDPKEVMSTAKVKITDQEEINSPSIVKCITDLSGHALYFSRARIPYIQKSASIPYYKHVGIYAFRRDFLLKYGTLKATPLQLTEDLEQLKVLEHGYKIAVVEVPSEPPHVDNPEDIKRVEAWLQKQNISL